MPGFQPTERRFLPRDQANERDLEDVEAYVRATIKFALPHVDDHEREDLVAQGLLIHEETQQQTPIGESYRQAFAARLANALRDYWRAQHPEVRRNTRARRRAAERGEVYAPRVIAATGLSPEHGDWARERAAPGQISDVEDEVFSRLKIAALEGLTASALMSDPQAAGLLFGIASHAPLPTGRAIGAAEAITELRLEAEPERPRFRFLNDI